jgi:hypothetical protein
VPAVAFDDPENIELSNVGDPTEAAGKIFRHDDELWYRIERHDQMPPFLLSVVSGFDHWLFLSSTGALTAGRRSPDTALFPYYNDDRIHDSQDQSGGKTVLRVHRDTGHVVWEPLSGRHAGLRRLTRSIARNVPGNRAILAETDHDLGLTFSQEWTSSERFGFVRRCTLTNLTGTPVLIDVLDGLQNLLPPGVDESSQLRFSTLVDGLKENELDEPTGLGIYRLSALRTDSAEPSESLRATTVWSRGLAVDTHLLSTEQVGRFRAGGTPVPERRMRGRRGAYLVTARCELAAGGEQTWLVVAEVDGDAAAVAATRAALRDGYADALVADVEADVRRGTERVRAIVAAADGLQLGADPLEDARHFTNTLFNVLRGGLPADGYRIGRADLLAYVAAAATRVGERHRDLLAALPATISRPELLAVAAAAGPDLERVLRAYLPLRYSRRHGDPSRPWNTFTINTAIGYEGNWRDIFQNWEALAYSFPGWLEAMIVKFVGSSTADGYNALYLTIDGFDWERLAPGESPLHLGYWGDHQVVYLLRLLEAADRLDPAMVGGLLHRRIFGYADVPYRIKPYPSLLADPHWTVDFDLEHDAELSRRRATDGAEGALLAGPDGLPVTVTLMEKLLVVALAKLTNYVPGLGIWMNTQRPDWNDGNNALVGYGVSVVTLCQLRSYLVHCRGLCTGDAEVSSAVALWLRRIASALAAAIRQHGRDAEVTDTMRRDLMDALGTAGGDYRATLYADGPSTARTTIPAAELRDFCDVALHHLDAAVRANRRADGLYHAYNLIRVTGDGITARRLYVMLEGQVAVLGSGLLSAPEAADLLDALRASDLYRPDQQSYLLYPDRELPRFLDKGVLPADALDRSALLRDQVDRGDRRIVVPDVDGVLRFHAGFRNAKVLAAALTGVPAADAATVLDLYEEVFDHQSYTGRSGTVFKYEGLGCIYWHMVAKLRLAVHELLAGLDTDTTDPAVLDRLRSHYAAIRAGIGVHKSPATYGAMPIDPYSHTPGFGGAQQPGMTGQVKEDILARRGELGVLARDGRLTFRPDLVRRCELRSEPGRFDYVDVHGRSQAVDVPAGALALTVGQIPVVVHRRGPARIVVTLDGAPPRTREGLVLDRETTAEILGRTGRCTRLDVHLDIHLGDTANPPPHGPDPTA